MDLDGPEEWHAAPDDEPSADDPWLPVEPAGVSRHMPPGGNSRWMTVAVAVTAAAAGAVVGLAVVHWPGNTTGAAPTASAPAASASASPGSQEGGGNGGLPPLPPASGAGELRVQVIGTVTAVTGTSITLGGNGPSVTAAITSSTKFDGTARNAAAIKTGDQVSATLTGTPTKLTATSIQDPAATS